MTEYRASFDATIKFSNGGDLTAHGFRVDVPSPGIGQDGIAALFVASLGLLMTDRSRSPIWRSSPNRTRERGEDRRITVTHGRPQAAGASPNSAMSSAPG